MGVRGEDIIDSGEDSDREMTIARRESVRYAREEEERRRTFGSSASGSGSGQGSTTAAPTGSTTGVGGGMFGGLRHMFSSRRGTSSHVARHPIDVDVEEEDVPRRPSVDPILFRKESSKQKKIKQMWSRTSVEKLGRAAAKLFIHANIPPNAANSPYWQVVIDAAAEAGEGIKAPTAKEIRGKWTDAEYADTKAYVNTFKPIWQARGCTIMCDGWTGPTRRSMINFMVYCHLGTVYHKSIDASDEIKNAKYIFSLMDKVVDEIGEENVVQIVTDNEATYKSAGNLLMLKRTHIFWSPCAAHCIDLILEDIGKRKNVKEMVEKAKEVTTFIYNHNHLVAIMRKFTKGRELLRPAATRFATNFIALESLYQHRGELSEMFASQQWLNTKYGKKTSGTPVDVVNTIRDNKYWKRVKKILKVMEPLMRVLRLVETDEAPTMGFLYDAMDKAKLAIQRDCSSWQSYWNLIDKRWTKQLHHDIHAAGYYLNPRYRYAQSFVMDDEIRIGLKNVIKRLEPDLDVQIKALNELDIFGTRQGSFGDTLAQNAVLRLHPADWWINFGEDTPALQKIAVRIFEPNNVFL